MTVPTRVAGLRARALATPRAIWLLLGLAFAVRLVLVIATPHWNAVDDPLDYDRHALSIADGHGYPDSTYAPGGGASALRPPLYPYVLGAVYAVGGHHWELGRLFAVLTGVITVALIGLIARQLWDRRVAYVAMALAALYPPLALVSNTLISESVALPLILGAIAAALAYRDRPAGLRCPVLAGLLCGLAILARPAAGVIVLPLVLGLWTVARGRDRAWTAPVAALLVAVLTLVPWTIRNASEMDAFVPVSTQLGYLAGGTYNDASANDPDYPYVYRTANLVPEYARLVTTGNADEAEVARKLTTGARRYISDHPAAPLKATYYNTLRLAEVGAGPNWGRISYGSLGIGSKPAKAARFSLYLLALVALAGLATRAVRRVPLWLGVFTPLLLWLSVVLISGDPRYRLPLEPFLIWAAALALVAAWDRRSRGRGGGAATA
jgi:4-amino-4-deoxy-L-arabinose transferase-like glycosyltransferase